MPCGPAGHAGRAPHAWESAVHARGGVRGGGDQGSTLGAEELLELCRGKLGAFKTPDAIHFLDELPKGPSGKIQRLKLADILGL